MVVFWQILKDCFWAIVLLASQVVCAVLNASKGRGYFSKYLMTKAVKIFYKKHDLYPSGLGDNLPAVQEWAEKCGEAIARLVPWLHLYKFLRCFLLLIPNVFPFMFQCIRPADFDLWLSEVKPRRTNTFNGYATTWRMLQLGLILIQFFEWSWN